MQRQDYEQSQYYQGDFLASHSLQPGSDEARRMTVTSNYRGSICAVQREKYGLGDPMTNADKIRDMSDEELAVFLSRDLKEPCDYCQLAVFNGACTETLCEDAMMKWLKQPTEGE